MSYWARRQQRSKHVNPERNEVIIPTVVPRMYGRMSKIIRNPSELTAIILCSSMKPTICLSFSIAVAQIAMHFTEWEMRSAHSNNQWSEQTESSCVDHDLSHCAAFFIVTRADSSSAKVLGMLYDQRNEKHVCLAISLNEKKKLCTRHQAMGYRYEIGRVSENTRAVFSRK